ncbi:MAG: cupin domain-containing protein [Chitinispirillaceae bacterium]
MGRKGTDQSLVGHSFSYADLVNYQDGAVVSRTVIDYDAGTVTVFAFDEHQSLSEHTAPFDALVEVIDGEANITIKGAEHVVKTGEQIIMPASVPHAVFAPKRFKMVLVMIRAATKE